MDGDLVYCSNIKELMEELQLEHTHEQWRLLTDSSQASLKVVLLHNVNKYPSIPRMRTFRFCCKKYAMKNTGGIYVLT
jgi:hypothetical protein